MSNVKKGLISSVLLVAESLAKKLIGVVSTLILARVLVPEDFGLVAIATLFMGFLDVLANTGTTQYLLRSDTIDSDTVNTSWTIDLILRTFIALVMIAVAPFVSDYYEDSRLTAIFYVFAALMIFRCLGNPGVAFLRREQNYAPLVKVSIIAKFLSVSIAVSIALIFESYWALILGQCANGITMVAGSYFIHPHKPKLTLINAKEQWHFSGWLIPQSILGYFRTQLDTIMVSSTFGKASLGSYHILKYLAFIPSSEILLPATQPLLVELNKTKNDATLFARQFNISFIGTMLLALPISGFMASQHQLIIYVFLGPNWVEYSELFACFSLLIPAFAILNQARRVLVVFGKTKHMLYYEIVSFFTIYGSLFLIGLEDLFLFGAMRVGLENAICLIFLIYITSSYTGLRNCLRLLTISLPALIAVVVASSVVNMVSLDAHYKVLNLILNGFIFMSLFLLTLSIIHYSAARKTEEWGYIEGLVTKGISLLKSKIA